MPPLRTLLAWLPLAALMGLAWWAYQPGLHGGFLFDDFNNLDQLGAYGRVDNFRSLILYLTSGTADPTGRPLSLLSFLLDARDWPADPAPFKRTGVLLHLVNGALLTWVLVLLGRRLAIDAHRARMAAMLGAALWTLHPLFVSTTLYVVQREAMLPATFTLLGMILWISGCTRFNSGQSGAVWRLVLGAWGCTLLATLSKANGVLLPLLLLATDWALPQPAPASPGIAHDDTRLSRVRLVLLGIPSVIVLAWLGSKLPTVWSGATLGRAWTVGERLLSEGRAVCDYLYRLWIPRADAASVFNDGFRVSTGLVRPWTTLPALIFLAAALALAVHLRRRQPAITLAIAFYFAGHLLESTVVQLELYFEHRNYLPAMPMFWPLALWLTGDGAVRTARMALVVFLPLMLAALCHARAGIWGKPYEQALLLAESNPESPRAQANAAAFELKHGRPDLAARRLAEATSRMPDEVQLALNWVAAECAQGAATPHALNAARYALAHNAGHTDTVKTWLIRAIAESRSSACKGLDLAELETMVHAVRDNPNFSRRRDGLSNVRHLEGRLALARSDGDDALRRFNEALAAFPIPDRALLQAALLGGAGRPELGLEHLRYFRGLEPADRGMHGMEAIHQRLLEMDGFWAGELLRMEEQLSADVKAASTGERIEGAS